MTLSMVFPVTGKSMISVFFLQLSPLTLSFAQVAFKYSGFINIHGLFRIQPHFFAQCFQAGFFCPPFLAFAHGRERFRIGSFNMRLKR